MRTPTRRDWVDPDKTILLSSKNRQSSSVRYGLRFQLVAATHASNRSAGVS